MTADALEGRPLKAQAGSHLKDREYHAYLKALNSLVPEILPLSWINVVQFAKLKAAQVQVFNDAISTANRSHMTTTPLHTPAPSHVPGLELALQILDNAGSIADLKSKLQAAKALATTAAPLPEPALSVDEAVEVIVDEGQVFASAWSMVDGPFDQGSAMDDANEAKDRFHSVVRAVLSKR